MGSGFTAIAGQHIHPQIYGLFSAIAYYAFNFFLEKSTRYLLWKA
jgi:hypothetical protein